MLLSAVTNWVGLAVLALSLVLDRTCAQVCVNKVIGDPIPSSSGPARSLWTTDSDHQSFLVAGHSSYADIDCPGLITEWEIYAKGQLVPTIRCHDITFQVWRPVDVSLYTYQLVAENRMTDLISVAPCNFPTAIKLPVPPMQQIPVHPNDVLGWTDNSFLDPGNSAERLMVYDEALQGSNQYDRVHIISRSSSCPLDVGTDCAWDDSKAELTVRGYSLKAIVNPASDPVFENMPTPVTTVVKENEPVGAHVFTVLARDFLPWNPVVPPQLTYRITDIQPQVPAPPLAAFAIDENSGEITTTMELDFEEVLAATVPPPAPPVGRVPYTITIEVEGISLNPITTTLVVEVEDINEAHDINNLPDTVVVDCSTTFGIGTPLWGPALCDDPDYDGGDPDFVDHKYILLDSQPTADLFEVTVGGMVQTKVELTTWLGEETVYVLKIGAGDGQFFSGPLQLYIDLRNISRPPMLLNLPDLAVVIDGTQGPGLVFEPLSAWADTNGNPVTYWIVAEYPHTWQPTFEIQNGNEVHSTAVADFDYLAVSEYQVEITVQDSLAVYAESSANLTVLVSWVNHPPVFVVTEYESTLPEGEAVGTVVPDVLLEATDRDIPLGDWLDFTLHGPDSHLFTVSNVTNLVYVAEDARVDPNTPSKTFNLFVEVNDWQGVVDTASLNITITDINDHAPVFDSTEYSAVVAEDAAQGTVILTVTCEDDDWGLNAAVTYTIYDPVANLYYEVANNGDLLVKQPINHQEYPTLSFEVVATDRGVPPLSDTATVHLTITPVNNHEPVFTPDFYNVDLKSDVEAGHVALTLNVVDPDSDSHFFVGQTSGDVMVERFVNHYRKYILYPMVTDKGSPEFYSDPATVRIDTYNPPKHLVNLHLMMPMVHFESKKEQFMAELNNILRPWVVFRDQYVTYGDRTIVTVYAWRDKSAATVNDLAKTKHFVHRDDILSQLQKNIQGMPSDVLRGPAFAEFQVVKVLATHPVWIVDTVEGIVTLSLLCVLVVLLVALLVYICKRNSWLCFKKTKVAPAPPPPGMHVEKPEKPAYDGDDFDLRYATPKKDAYTVSTWEADPLTSTAE